MCGLSCAVAIDQFATAVGHAAHHDVIIFGKVFAHNRAQFDLVAIAQKARQRRIDQKWFGNFHRLLSIAAELMRLRLTDRNDAIGREIIRRDKIENGLAPATGVGLGWSGSVV